MVTYYSTASSTTSTSSGPSYMQGFAPSYTLHGLNPYIEWKPVTVSTQTPEQLEEERHIAEERKRKAAEREAEFDAVFDG